jgi:hypothetical protein
MTTQPSSSVSYESSPLSTCDLRSFTAETALGAISMAGAGLCYRLLEMRRILGVAVTLTVLMPCVALAQPPRPPVVELGAQGSKRINDSAPVAWALRLTLPLGRQTAIEATADIQRTFVFEKEYGGDERRSARGFSAHWRQTVFTSGRVQIFGVLGAGTNRVEHDVPERVFQTKDGPGVTPADRWAVSEFVVHFGPAVQVELAPWLALRGDLRGRLGSQHSGVRGLVGAVIPIRGGRTVNPPNAPAPATPLPSAQSKTTRLAPPPSAWRRVKPGREVWVRTATVSLIHGDVVAISDSSLTVLEQGRDVTIRLDDVRWVEGRDGVRNGFLIGMVPGAVAGGLVLHSAASGICGSCEIDEGPWAVAGAVAGALVGGLLGAMVDALTPGRQILFVRDVIRVKAVMTPTTKGLDLTIGWR